MVDQNPFPTLCLCFNRWLDVDAFRGEPALLDGGWATPDRPKQKEPSFRLHLETLHFSPYSGVRRAVVSPPAVPLFRRLFVLFCPPTPRGGPCALGWTSFVPRWGYIVASQTVTDFRVQKPEPADNHTATAT